MSEGSPPRPRLLALVGPTGTGKSAIAVAAAQVLDGEIVNCDALQIYKRFRIGTSKPGPDQMGGVPHHLFDIREPVEAYSMAEYVRDAEVVLAEIAGRNRVPIVTGGTGLYLRALLRGILDSPSHDPALRVRMDRVQARYGTWKLHRCLVRLDPDSAGRLAPTDAQRIKRALDLALRSRSTWSERIRSEGTWDSRAERYDVLKIALDRPRPDLRQRLAVRVHEFFEQGWVEEVEALLGAGVPESAHAFQAIGYREILQAIQAGEDPLERIPKIVQGTVRYAKRQRTWFRREPGIRWLDAGDPRLLDRVLELWRAPAD